MQRLRTILITAIFACTSAAFAAQKEAAKPAPIFVTLTSPDYSFEAMFSGLALQGFANNCDYAAEALPFDYGTTAPALSPNWVIPNISPDFHFGFDVGVAGIFHCAKSRLMLNWERYHTSNDSGSIEVSSISSMVGPFFEIGPDASSYKKAKGSVNFHFDEANATYGTFVQFGPLLRMNLFAGASFMRVVEHRFTTISDLPGTIVRTLRVPAKFTGGGPQLGCDFNYTIADGLQLTGLTRASIWVGRFFNKTTFTTTSGALESLSEPDPNIQTTTVHHKTGMVPGFEGKLGLAYEYLFCSNYMLKVEAGYQVQIYINAIRSIDMGSEVDLPPIGDLATTATGVYARTFERVVSDFGLAGPYASINFGF